MSHASVEMPYFIKPSSKLTQEEKKLAYEQAASEINALTASETDVIMKMVSINCILKTHLPYFYWVGFYCVRDGALIVGPYQGTLGCLHIDFGKGVCGQVAQSKKAMIIDDVYALIQGEQHIACDPNSQSEIVLPVVNSEGKLIAVFDVDSSSTHSFDHIDQHYLELILKESFAQGTLTQTQLL